MRCLEFIDTEKNETKVHRKIKTEKAMLETKIIWDNKKINLVVYSKSDFFIEEFTSKFDNISVIKKNYKAGIHNFKFKPWFSNYISLVISNNNEKHKYIINDHDIETIEVNENFNMFTCCSLFKYKTINLIWSDKSSICYLYENESIKNYIEINWLLNKNKKRDIGDLLDWCFENNINAKITYI